MRLLIQVAILAALIQAQIGNADSEALLWACGNDPKIEWDFAVDPQITYTVQKWTGWANGKAGEPGGWQNVASSIDSRGSYSFDASELESGRFYRVEGCSDSGCESSSVVWTPVLACDDLHDQSLLLRIKDQLPTDDYFVLRKEDGTEEKFQLSKERSCEITRQPTCTYWLMHRIGQWNNYLAMQEAEKMAPDMPPMKLRYIGDSTEMTFADSIYGGVFNTYERRRTGKRANFEGMGLHEENNRLPQQLQELADEQLGLRTNN